MLLDSLLPPLFLFSLWLRRFIDFSCFCYCYRRVTQKNCWQSSITCDLRRPILRKLVFNSNFSLNFSYSISFFPIFTHSSRIQQLVIRSVICPNLILSLFSAFLTNSRFQIIQSGLYVILLQFLLIYCNFDGELHREEPLESVELRSR